MGFKTGWIVNEHSENHLNKSQNKRFDIQYLSKESDILFCSITHANLGQFSKPGTDLESTGPEVFKTPPSFGWDIWG